MFKCLSHIRLKSFWIIRHGTLRYFVLIPRADIVFDRMYGAVGFEVYRNVPGRFLGMDIQN